jgi:molybdenum cofactor cytidylyltransferase
MKGETGNIAAIILAAGEGRRMGRTKALVKIDDSTFLQRIVERLRDAAIDPLIVVGGANAKDVERHCKDLNVNFAENKNWQSGQFSSLKKGIGSIGARPKGVLVALVDHPVVENKTYEQLKKYFLANPDSIAIPVYQGRRGHPTIIPMPIADEIIELPDSMNLREVIKDHQDKVSEMQVGDGGILKNIDTPSDLKEIKS